MSRKSDHLISVSTNMALYSLYLAISLSVFYLLPLLSRGEHGNMLIAASLFVYAPTVNLTWALLHEGIHGNVHPSSKVNKVLCRILSGIAYGTTYRAVMTGHLYHHKHNLTLRGYYVKDPTFKDKLRLHFIQYLQLLLDPYLLAFAANVIIFLPREWLRRVFSRNKIALHILKDENIPEVRFDSAFIILLFASSAILFQERWWVVGIVSLIRCVVVCFFDGIYHFQQVRGDNLFGFNLRLPIISGALLHFNLHGIHHQNPGLPWSGLKAEWRKQGGHYDGQFFSFALRQLRPFVAAPEQTVEQNDQAVMDTLDRQLQAGPATNA
jgi:fatty acid desaturase